MPQWSLTIEYGKRWLRGKRGRFEQVISESDQKNSRWDAFARPTTSMRGVEKCRDGVTAAVQRRRLSSCCICGCLALALIDRCSLVCSAMKVIPFFKSFFFLPIAGGFERSLMDVGGRVTRGCYLFVVWNGDKRSGVEEKTVIFISEVQKKKKDTFLGDRREEGGDAEQQK